MKSNRKIGKHNVSLSELGFGTAPLGGLHNRISEEAAETTLEAAWKAGVRYFDTAPWYGNGLSELRLGSCLRHYSRDEYVVSTKVGRTFHRPLQPSSFCPEFWKGGLRLDYQFDYTYDGIMRAYEQSLMRLGIDSIDMLLIHDLDISEIGSQPQLESYFRDLEDSGWRALELLRSTAEVKAVGAGVNILGTVPEMLQRFDLDFFLVAMPYTLINQEPLDLEFPLCERRDVAIVIGSPFASGILATGASHNAPQYNYADAPAWVIEKVKRIEVVCAQHKIPLAAAALQFPLRHPLVASVIPGAITPQQISENARLLHIPIPEEFWRELRTQGLLREPAVNSEEIAANGT